MAVNLKAKSRDLWRKRGYYVTNGETHNAHSHRTEDFLGFADLVALPMDVQPWDRSEVELRSKHYGHGIEDAWIYIQSTSWSNATARRNKILRELTGKGKWATPIRTLAEAVLRHGDLILVEGWRRMANGRYERREIWITLEMIYEAQDKAAELAAAEEAGGTDGHG